MTQSKLKTTLETQRDIGARGVRLRSTEWSTEESKDRDALLIIPGVLCPRQSFAPLAKHLAQRFRVVTFDFPGFGESEKPAPRRFDYNIETFADAVVDLLSGLQLARAHLLGHGVGGAVALHVAARSSENVRRLGLIAPLAYPHPVSSLHRRLVGPLLGGIFFRQVLGERLYTSLFKEYICATTTSSAIARNYEAISSPAARGALLATLRACLDTRSTTANARRTRASTLVIWGREDKIFPVEAARSLSREMPDAGLAILPTGHAPHEEAPGMTAEILIPFFEGRRRGSLVEL